MPEQFFAQQLRGETPVSSARAERLCAMAQRFYALHLWEVLDETQLVFVKDAGGELHACSVMGALGECFMMTAYRGLEGYYFFRKLQSSKTITAGEFFSDNHSTSVEYVPRRELTPPDRELLKTIGYPMVKGQRVPKFRTIRPGYHPWYVTGEEAQSLADCLLSVVSLFEAGHPVSAWQVEGTYPLVSCAGAGSVEEFTPPREPLALPPAQPVDQDRVRRVLARSRAASGALEADHFYGPAKIGEKDERKACLRLALVVDAGSGMAFPPEAALPEADTGWMLAEAIFKALETGAPVPREIHVREARYRLMIEPLAAALGTVVRVRKSLPALDSARNALLEMMGGSGSLV